MATVLSSMQNTTLPFLFTEISDMHEMSEVNDINEAEEMRDMNDKMTIC